MAWKKLKPTIGHMIKSMVQSARPLRMPRSSFMSSGRSGVRRTAMTSGERKEDILQACRPQTCRPQLRLSAQLVERAYAAHRAIREQHKAVADAPGIAELMDREHERAAGCGDAADET